MLRFVKYMFASFLGVFFALSLIFSFFTYLISSNIVDKVEVINFNLMILGLLI